MSLLHQRRFRRSVCLRISAWCFPIVLTCALLFLSLGVSPKTAAQGPAPALVSQETSTRAIAVDSVMQTREPFAVTSPLSWGNDTRTRIMLFAMNLTLQPNETPAAVSANAEDGGHNIYSLSVEYVGPVHDQEWMTSIVVRLNDQMGDLGDVLVGISYRGVSSNRVRVAIGHLGDG